jgi:hypothetical protein
MSSLIFIVRVQPEIDVDFCVPREKAAEVGPSLETRTCRKVAFVRCNTSTMGWLIVVRTDMIHRKYCTLKPITVKIQRC